jgi:hypothetical protein
MHFLSSYEESPVFNVQEFNQTVGFAKALDHGRADDEPHFKAHLRQQPVVHEKKGTRRALQSSNPFVKHCLKLFLSMERRKRNSPPNQFMKTKISLTLKL